MFRVVREERKVFDRIPECAYAKGENKKGKKYDFSAAFVFECEVEEEERRERGKEKDGDLGSDGAKCMWEAFISEEFRCEHDEEYDKEECITREMWIVILAADAGHE